MRRYRQTQPWFPARAVGVVCACLCLILVAGCGRDDAPPQEAAIRVGYLNNDLHHLPLFVALKKGFFAEAGLQVEVGGIFKAGPEEMSAFGAGALDIGYVGQAPATAAVLNGTAAVTFLAQVNLNGSAIVVGSESSLGNVQDLKGLLVAIPGHATMQDFLLHRAIRQSGLQPGQVNIIVLKPPEMYQALVQGSIAAFIAWEPYPAQAVMRGGGRVLMQSEAIWDEHPCCVLVAATRFVENNRLQAEKIIAVHERSCRFIAANPEEAADIGAAWTGLERPTVREALRTITYTGAIDSAKATEFVDFLRRFKYLNPRSKKRQVPVYGNSQ